jgi:hypothetical protein
MLSDLPDIQEHRQIVVNYPERRILALAPEDYPCLLCVGLLLHPDNGQRSKKPLLLGETLRRFCVGRPASAGKVEAGGTFRDHLAIRR